MQTKHKIIYQLKRGLSDRAKAEGKPAKDGVEFATASDLMAVMDYSSLSYFKRQWLKPLTMLPPNLYSIDEFAEAWVKGDIPVNKGRRGRYERDSGVIQGYDAEREA